jgi:hypothetical protein
MPEKSQDTSDVQSWLSALKALHERSYGHPALWGTTPSHKKTLLIDSESFLARQELERILDYSSPLVPVISAKFGFHPKSSAWQLSQDAENFLGARC